MDGRKEVQYSILFGAAVGERLREKALTVGVFKGGRPCWFFVLCSTI